MIEFYSPCEEEIHAIQCSESAFYWSGCAEVLFRKHGLISCVKRPTKALPKGLPVLLRGTSVTWPLAQPMLVEGPLSESLLSVLELSFETRSCTSMYLYDANKKILGNLLYTDFSTKRIPQSRFEKTESSLYRDQNTFWNNRTFTVQVFKPTGIWYPAAFAKFDENSPHQVIAVTDGKRFILGAPLFDIILFNHAIPALEEGFFTTLKGTYLFQVEKWLVEQLCNLAALSNIALTKQTIWPEARRASLSIRHDYDRPISDDRLKEILSFYCERSIKSTWFLLVDKPPPIWQINKIIEEGHEVALHTVAPYSKDFNFEIERFKTLTGVFPLGYTCHGGIGSRGQLGLTQHRWAENVGMLYGEMIGRCRGLPHPVLKPDCGLPVMGRLIIQNCHHSLDLGMKPDAHQLDHLSQEIPKRLDEGSHVIPMNHPDIHWPELQTLIDRLDLSDVWLCTLEEAARWARASKFAFNGYSDEILEYSFPKDFAFQGQDL